MNSSVEVSVEPKRVGAHNRFIALFSLVALAAGVSWVGKGAYEAATDSWMAPITLSADNDQILQINVKLNEQIVQRDKLKADIQRIDADLGGIDVAIAKLGNIQATGKEALRWTQYTTGAQTAAMDDRVKSLADQKQLLDVMLTRQETIAKNAKQNAEAGLLSRQELDREAQVSDQLKLALAQNVRDTSEARMQSAQFLATTGVLKDAMANRSRVGGVGILPEVAAGQEREVRMELELIKLQAERRALVADRAIFVESLDRMEEIFKQLRARPVYRAIEAKTDVAFVPYTQLEGVTAGAELVSCKWVLFKCAVVGHIAEVVPGEVVAQDPWSDVARGQYVILDLTDREAVKEKVIRSRKAR